MPRHTLSARAVEEMWRYIALVGTLISMHWCNSLKCSVTPYFLLIDHFLCQLSTVFSSCAHIPKTHFDISLKRIGCYGYVILYMFSIKKFPIFNVFWQFLISGKIQDGAQYSGHLEWRHRPPAVQQPIMCTSSCRAHHRLSIKGGIYSKYCNITKTQRGGGASINPLVPRWGCDFACTYEGQGYQTTNFKPYKIWWAYPSLYVGGSRSTLLTTSWSSLSLSPSVGVQVPIYKFWWGS